MRTLTPAEVDQLHAAADLALATGCPVACLGYALAPDTIMLEAIANSEPAPATWALHRPDGRTVYLYRAPEGIGQ